MRPTMILAALLASATATAALAQAPGQMPPGMPRFFLNRIATPLDAAATDASDDDFFPTS